MAAGLLVGVAAEAFQGRIPGRSPDAIDVLADLAGLGAAAMCCSIWPTSAQAGPNEGTDP